MSTNDPAVHRPNWARQLEAGLTALSLSLDERQQTRLLDYLALLAKWNRAYNLTAVREPAQMVSRQLLDSLSLLPWVRGPRLLDVGTGAGLPGIPLAIALPELACTLLDANGKKIRFVRQAVLELGLDNVQVEQQRIEAFVPAQPFDTITSRAFASLADFVGSSERLLAPGGQWLALKGPLAEVESEALPAGLARNIIPLQVPGESATRHLVQVTRRG